MILEQDEIRLRPFREADLPVVIAALSDWAVAQWLNTPPYPYDEADGRAWLEHVANQHAGGQPGSFAVAAPSDDALLGCIGCTSIAARPAALELGYWFKPDAWGRGVATRAAGIVLAHAFNQLDAEQVVARTDPDHHASGRVLAKAGFRRLGERPLDSPTRRGSLAEVHFELTAKNWRIANESASNS